MKFAAFVMTYRRSEVLEETINRLFSQTLPPQKILIIDNDPDKSAENIANKFHSKSISYYPVGYNSGPAGAAYYGLKILAEEDWDWIAWVDDDDPPVFEDTFQILLEVANSNQKIGCVGSVGHRFNLRNGLINRISDFELNASGIIYVDNIAGNMSKIVNADVIKESNILPNELLFFGLEELEFDLRLKKAGYLLACKKEFYLKHRIINDRVGVKIKKGNKKNSRGLIRDFYSNRNSLFILKWNKAYFGVCSVFFRILIKMLFGFKYGLNYGISNFKLMVLVLNDFVLGRLGSRLSIDEKINK